MSINAILAHDAKFGIGKNNDLPWPKNTADMEWFRKNTAGGIIVMGRKTWESLGNKKLPNRENVVITTSPIEGHPDDIYYGDMHKVLQLIESKNLHKDIWVIGGANLYSQSIKYCDSIYVTEFGAEYDCDTFIDESLFDHFSIVETRIEDGLTFKIYKRKL